MSLAACGYQGRPCGQCYNISGSVIILYMPGSLWLPGQVLRVNSDSAIRTSQFEPRKLQFVPRNSHLSIRTSHLANRTSQFEPPTSQIAPRTSHWSTLISALVPFPRALSMTKTPSTDLTLVSIFGIPIPTASSDDSFSMSKPRPLSRYCKVIIFCWR